MPRSGSQNIEELAGSLVRLRPLQLSDTEGLFAAGNYPDLWKWTVSQISALSDMQAYVQSALACRVTGDCFPFVTLDAKTGEIIGSTRFGSISIIHRRMEIGWTWLTPSRQRTGANTEAKLLMLTHAFEAGNCIRVELKTDALNTKSRNAMLRIGAKEEGILRQHILNGSGRIRDSAYYSIIASEWPAVKSRLVGFLEHHSERLG